MFSMVSYVFIRELERRKKCLRLIEIFCVDSLGTETSRRFVDSSKNQTCVWLVWSEGARVEARAQSSVAGQPPHQLRCSAHWSPAATPPVLWVEQSVGGSSSDLLWVSSTCRCRLRRPPPNLSIIT